MRRPGPARGTTSADVLDAAVALLDRGGVEALSVRRVAERLGVSRQVVYTHFGSMPGLLAAVHAHGFARLAARVEAVHPRRGTAAHVLAIAAAYVAFARRSPSLYDLMFATSTLEVPRDATDPAVARRAFDVVVDAVDALALHTDRTAATTAAIGLWAAVHGLVSLEREGHVPPGRTDEATTHAVGAMLAGWRGLHGA